MRFSRIAAATASAAMSAVLIATLAGCASEPRSSLAVPAAKAKTIAIERQIAAYVPAADVIRTTYSRTSRVIFPCLGKDDESYWPGTLTTSLKPGTDTAPILTAIAAIWTKKPGWSVRKTMAADGDPSIDLKSDTGYSFTVEFDQGPVLTVNALSACFSNVGLAGKSSY